MEIAFDEKTIFARQLAKIRIYIGIEQAELARRCNIPPSVISHYESGRREPSIENYRKIVRALNVPSDALLFENMSVENVSKLQVAKIRASNSRLRGCIREWEAEWEVPNEE
jgi:transcriptional regulator with XRE-family HTH domain